MIHTMQTETQFSLKELLSLYDTVQNEIFNLTCSDFEGCEVALVKDHTIAAKLLQAIIQQRVNAN
jgi:hypothetical protein